METITSFSGRHGFLSNFHRQAFYLPGWPQIMPTAEHAYQACKAVTGEQAHWVLEASSPQLAKSRGRQVDAYPDWEMRKREVMLKILLAKFTRNWDNTLADQLIATGDAVLVEGNTWGDTFWGAVPLVSLHTAIMPVWPVPGAPAWHGRNWLGRELMMVREVLA